MNSDNVGRCPVVKIAVMVWVCALVGAVHASGITARQDVNNLLAAHWQRAQQEQVFFRTDADSWRPDGAQAEVSSQARARRQAFNDDILARLDRIDAGALTGQDRINYRIFRYERYLISLADFRRYNREHIALLQEAISRGYTHYCESTAGYETTISEQIVDRPEDSSLYAPFARFPDAMPPEQQADLRQRGRDLIAASVVPAYRELYAFFVDDYMPECRDEPGISSLAGGADYYAYLLRFFTTTDLLEKTALIAKRMDGLMPRYFGRLT
jgi:uncharacterized protein (DUF885 family)